MLLLSVSKKRVVNEKQSMLIAITKNNKNNKKNKSKTKTSNHKKRHKNKQTNQKNKTEYKKKVYNNVPFGKKDANNPS